jgi:Ulp1 family protease
METVEDNHTDNIKPLETEPSLKTEQNDSCTKIGEDHKASKMSVKRRWETVYQDKNIENIYRLPGGLTIYEEQVRQCYDKQWLPGIVIDFYIEAVHTFEKMARDGTHWLHPFRSDFWFFVKIDRYEMVKKLINELQLVTTFENILQFPDVIIPICDNLHWSLAVVSIEKKEIQLYEPLVDRVRSRKIYSKLKNCFSWKWPFNWKMKMMKVEYQQNPYDCGVFVCRYVDILYERYMLTDWKYWLQPQFSELNRHNIMQTIRSWRNGEYIPSAQYPYELGLSSDEHCGVYGVDNENQYWKLHKKDEERLTQIWKNYI